MSDESRSIQLEVEVSGSPEEVWRAIATGPGISSWYVPHTVEERDGGAATATRPTRRHRLAGAGACQRRVRSWTV